MAFRFLDSVAVAVHGHSSPTDAEWRAWVEACRDMGAPRALPVFVMTLGGAPNASQRAQLDEAAAGARQRVAVMSGSAFVRGVVTAIGWAHHVGIKGFAPGDVDAAIEHLGLPRDMRAEVERTVEELRSAIGEDDLRVETPRR